MENKLLNIKIMNGVSKTTMNKIEGKLRIPIHIKYIADFIVKDSIEQTKKILDKLVDDNIVVEMENNKGFYMLSSNKK
jgi:hypothetical protein|tara:strand:- start:5394 stop:5627 length:234 start_codon:yes stop_codon:yes gene_type:complete